MRVEEVDLARFKATLLDGVRCECQRLNVAPFEVSVDARRSPDEEDLVQAMVRSPRVVYWVELRLLGDNKARLERLLSLYPGGYDQVYPLDSL